MYFLLYSEMLNVTNCSYLAQIVTLMEQLHFGKSIYYVLGFFIVETDIDRSASF